MILVESIQNSAKYLRLSFLQKWLTTESSILLTNIIVLRVTKVLFLKRLQTKAL